MANDRSLAWPELTYDAFAPTARLLHRGLQAVGKLTLLKPAEPHWANAALLPTSRGLTTGPIPWHDRVFTIEVDFISHALQASASDGRAAAFALVPMSVADWLASLYAVLDAIGVEHRINVKPHEVADPVPFDEDTQEQPYATEIVSAWWRALLSSFRVFQVHHGRFAGIAPPVGVLWGSLDLRDARYGGGGTVATGATIEGARAEQTGGWETQVGWWHGSESHRSPAYFAFTSPAPAGIERAAVRPDAAHWDPALGEFILDYDDVRDADDPAAELLSFCESTYQAGRPAG